MPFATQQQKNEYQKRYLRERYKNDEQHRLRQKARSKVGQAIKRGLLVRGCCVSCGTADAEAHHDDYSKPLEVLWLCRPCHLKHHGGSFNNAVLAAVQ